MFPFNNTLIMLLLLLRRLKLVVVVAGDAEALLVAGNVVAVVDELRILVRNVEIHSDRQKRVPLASRRQRLQYFVGHL